MSRAADTMLGRSDGSLAASLPDPALQGESAFGNGGGWTWGYATLIGTRHRQQAGGVCEDAARVRLLAPESSYAGACGVHVALADGVSGGAFGRVCAQTHASHCIAWNPQGGHSLGDWVSAYANLKVQEALRQVTQEPGATTGVAAWIDPQGNALVNRIGDCRAYLWNLTPDGEIALELLMPDQTMASMGYAMPDSPNAAQPGHMIGNDNTGIPEFVKVQLPSVTAGGLLLCSDGFHEFIPPQALTSELHALLAMRQHDGGILAHWCDAMARQAQEHGSDDDVAVLVLCRSAL